MRGVSPPPLSCVVYAVADEHVLSELLERRHHHRAVRDDEMEVLQRGDDRERKAVKSRKQHLRNRGYEGEGGDDEEGERGGEEYDRAHE